MQAADPAAELVLPLLVSLLSPLAIGVTAYLLLLRRNPGVFWAAAGLGVAATLVAILVQVPLLVLLSDFESIRTMLAVLVIVTSLIEEGAKFAGGWLVVLSFRRRMPGNPLLVIGIFVAVALTFATVENVFYTIGAIRLLPENVWIVVISRALATIPMHSAAGLIMGVIGARLFAEGRGTPRTASAAILLPYLLHVAFNLIVVLSVPEGADAEWLSSPQALPATIAAAFGVYLVAAVIIGLVVRRYAHRAA